ncbi:efflux RND transporter periplasmic adaptor subunit [Thioalkalivibrio sp.]|uniref:efflux RND transporter periplasmic adaptor subunit n=1 Tax=Thioalkalivibrio sp. TaxID=2093813 RepID=UPI0035614E83
MSPRLLLRRHRSTLLIAAVALLLVLWIASGVVGRDPPVMETRQEHALPTVAVRVSDAERIQRLVTLQGEVLPDQQVTVRAETEGRLVGTPVPLGEAVGAGTVIARIGMDDREAQLRRAEAAVRGRQADFRAAEELAEEGYQAQLQVDSARAELEAARAELESVRLDIEHTRVKAPIAGVLNHRTAEVGDYLSVGAAVAEIVENNPLKAVVQVPQHNIHRIRQGQTASLEFGNDRGREGTIRHVSARADTQTRTFRVEIEVPNADRILPSGISVQVRIPVQEVMAHRISPALVTLDPDGRLGIKILENEDRVAFHPIDPVRADSEGLWVDGLPETVRIITAGQGFVNEGDRVQIRPEDAGPVQ